jgi:hypothetical protein
VIAILSNFKTAITAFSFASQKSPLSPSPSKNDRASSEKAIAF